MVIESVVKPWAAVQHPRRLIIIGFLYVSIAIILSLWIFQSQSSLIMIFLTVFACVPLMYKTLSMEEEKDKKINSEYQILKEHSKVIFFLLYLFIGMVLAFSFWFVIVPDHIGSILFNVQLETVLDLTGNVVTFGTFLKILMNNIKVLVFCILFSFIYGAGAIFILTWNASVVGTAIGSFIKENLQQAANLLGFQKIALYFQIISTGLLQYALHGIPEIAGYFIGGLAGGIISFSIVKYDFRTKKFEKILLDSSNLIIISILFILVAAILEVYVTPLFF